MQKNESASSIIELSPPKKKLDVTWIHGCTNQAHEWQATAADGGNQPLEQGRCWFPCFCSCRPWEPGWELSQSADQRLRTSNEHAQRSDHTPNAPQTAALFTTDPNSRYTPAESGFTPALQKRDRGLTAARVRALRDRRLPVH